MVAWLDDTEEVGGRGKLMEVAGARGNERAATVASTFPGSRGIGATQRLECLFLSSVLCLRRRFSSRLGMGGEWTAWRTGVTLGGSTGPR